MRRLPGYREPVIWPYVLVLSLLGVAGAVWWLYYYLVLFLPHQSVAFWLITGATAMVVPFATVTVTRWVTRETPPER